MDRSNELKRVRVIADGRIGFVYGMESMSPYHYPKMMVYFANERIVPFTQYILTITPHDTFAPEELEVLSDEHP